MAELIAGMTVSLDGFVADTEGDASALYPDLDELRDQPYMRAMADETGSVLMGRRTFAMAPDPDEYADTYELQAPIFVVTSTPPARHPKENDRLTFTFVTDGLASAVAQARTVAGDRKVQVVGGVELNRGLLELGEVDELRIDVMPVLLGDGLRFLGGVAPAGVRFEKVGVDDVGQRTSLRFRAVR